ncbi:MAG: alpha/beta hydrolase [Bdellovibrionota bacterium]
MSRGQLHAITKGVPGNPAVVCIHGLLGSSRNLFRLVEAIADQGFYVVAYDQRGHGHSFHADDYHLETLAQDALSIIEEKGLGQAHLIGHSLGARVALAAAATAVPRKIKSLTMLDAGIRVNPTGRESVHSIIDPLPESFGSKLEAEQFLERFQQSVKLFLLSNLRTRDSRLHWNFDLRGIRKALLPAMDHDQTQAWKNISCPILVLRGENSEYLSQEDVDQMQALRPDARFVVVSKAGHWVHVDNFVETSQAVLQFLESVK